MAVNERNGLANMSTGSRLSAFVQWMSIVAIRERGQEEISVKSVYFVLVKDIDNVLFTLVENPDFEFATKGKSVLVNWWLSGYPALLDRGQ